MDAPKSSRQGRQTPVRAQAVNLPSVARANSSPSPQTTLNGDSDSLPLFVRGLPKEEAITARDLVHFFSRFGTVVRAKVQNRDGVHTGAATVDLIDVQRDFKNSILSDHVQFEVYKENPRVVFNIQRDRKRSGQHPNRHRPRFETDVLEMDRFTVGTLMNSNTFYECWECSQAISLEFEYSDWQSATVSFVRNGTTYQLVYKFKNIRNTFKVDKRTNGTQVTYHIVASLSLPPQVLYVAEDPFFWRAKGQERERIAFPYIAGQQLPLNAFFNDPEYEGPLVRAVPDTGRFMDHHYEVTYESAAGIAGVAERKFLDTMARLVHYGIITDRRIFAEIDFLKPADVPTPYNIQDAPIP
ncbi:uncharacterized protein EV422DRAFT_538530 [Fimicolochytrium jonesii]|uniref:uncharacterized protein n=1 Tax=Fimicolochytrium jonesii TaxID=1396493 RepID=UPI0022FDE6D0|nr:uncharacterized protein EV422DRAFT_538530 [Fimicolochytrium jonesii]KAI8818421.1 hypothetical protein EV422DRAFT_538530 [Fimicolochytrium jonesii]